MPKMLVFSLDRDSILVDRVGKTHLNCSHAQVYERMLRSGYIPTSTTYTALISSYGKAGQLDRAIEVFNLMVNLSKLTVMNKVLKSCYNPQPSLFSPASQTQKILLVGSRGATVCIKICHVEKACVACRQRAN